MPVSHKRMERIYVMLENYSYNGVQMCSNIMMKVVHYFSTLHLNIICISSIKNIQQLYNHNLLDINKCSIRYSFVCLANVSPMSSVSCRHQRMILQMLQCLIFVFTIKALKAQILFGTIMFSELVTWIITKKYIQHINPQNMYLIIRKASGSSSVSIIINV